VEGAMRATHEKHTEFWSGTRKAGNHLGNLSVEGRKFWSKFTGFYGGNLRERDHLEERGVDGRIILGWIFSKWDGEAWTGLIWLRTGKAECDCGNEPSGSIQCTEFID
jgi:hypothetical protein